ncbi:MAG: hypothetical protein J6T06_17720, partial [Victivallales bacterium]|nr:hypothetical protein [Victivallales bacterium]
TSLGSTSTVWLPAGTARTTLSAKSAAFSHNITLLHDNAFSRGKHSTNNFPLHLHGESLKPHHHLENKGRNSNRGLSTATFRLSSNTRVN